MLADELRRTKTVVLLVYLISMVVTLAAHPIFLGVLLAYGSGISPVPFNASWQANVTLSLAGTSVALAYGSMTVLAFAGARARGHWPPFVDLLFTFIVCHTCCLRLDHSLVSNFTQAQTSLSP